MRGMKFISLAVILVTMAAFAVAQPAPAQTPPTLKHVPITNTPSNSGKEMFNMYCAVCHGTDGKGNGPAASAMKTPPIDLTALAQNNGGKYPSARVSAVLRGQANLASHAARTCRFGVHCSPASARVRRARCSSELPIWLTTSERCKQSKLPT
jgi:cytochrome c553